VHITDHLTSIAAEIICDNTTSSCHFTRVYLLCYKKPAFMLNINIVNNIIVIKVVTKTDWLKFSVAEVSFKTLKAEQNM
jgi:hypothetical protein